MSRPPANWLHSPAAFGFVVRKSDWKEASTDAERAELAAAQQHHQLAFRVRALKPLRGLNDERIARELGVTPTTIGRYLRGDTPIPLIAFNRLAITVGLNVEVIFTE